MDNHYYTIERNHQILISVLKANGIRKVIASPGTTNISLVGSIQHDPWFEIYSCVDERSAAYMACGMAAESGESVILSCTGATASRNYMPALTEAYYRKLPVLAITSHQGQSRVGQLIAQNIDRSTIPNDIAKLSVTLTPCLNYSDEMNCELSANRAIQELKRNGGGPVHINLISSYSWDFSTKELPPARIIHRIAPGDTIPDIPEGNVAVFIGCHRRMSKEEEEAIDAFCATYNAVCFCDHTSGYHGKYRLDFSLVCAQKLAASENTKVNTLIQIGEVSGDYYSILVEPSQVWRVSEDGEMRDTWQGRLTHVFQASEVDFFQIYAKENAQENSWLESCKAEYQCLYDMIPELPFSNLWLAKNLSPRIPVGSAIHFGILNTLRSWNFFRLPQGVTSFSNVGGFGIDGNISTLLGAALASPDKLFFAVIGDLSFFYDLNCWGNRHLPTNMRVILVNNGRGQEFVSFENRASKFGKNADLFIAAGGHFGQQSNTLVRHYAENLGIRYLSSATKDEAWQNADIFFTPDKLEAPIIWEVFTQSDDENAALKTVRSLNLEKGLKKMEEEYKRCRLLSHLTFGKKHKQYKKKKRLLGLRLKELRS